MEGYYWRITQPRGGHVVVVLCGVNRPAPAAEPWGAVAVAAHPGGFRRQLVAGAATASPSGGAVTAGAALTAVDDRLGAAPADDCRLEVRLHEASPWPHRVFGGLGPAQSIPGLGQYWHPHLLGARVEGHAVLGERTVDLDGATAYAEKNWGAGFPGRWWWGQAHGFDDPEVCVAFAGGLLERGRLAVAATSVVVHLGPVETLRFVPPLALTRAEVRDGVWRVHARSARHRVAIEGDAHGREPHLLPVPLPAERRVVNRARQHLAGRLRVEIRRDRRVRYRGESLLAGLEVGGAEDPPTA